MWEKMTTVMLSRVNVLIAMVFLSLAACGNDDNSDEDTLFTGLSSVVLLGLAIWLFVRAARKRG